jgi:hypothetical protein
MIAVPPKHLHLILPAGQSETHERLAVVSPIDGIDMFPFATNDVPLLILKKRLNAIAYFADRKPV